MRDLARLNTGLVNVMLSEALNIHNAWVFKKLLVLSLFRSILLDTRHQASRDNLKWSELQNF